MIEELRSGFSTGACAAAAAKAAALALIGEACAAVDLTLPTGETITLPLEDVEPLSPTAARATVRKDAGDDPDITDGVLVVVTIALGGDTLTFQAGDGVGTVTKAGLQLPPGEPAINPVPRQMITDAITDTLGPVGATVTVSIPGGKALAEKTFNPRLGIEGGLSILGTSGRVTPKSEDAWLRSLLPQLDVARAAGHETLYLVPGGFGERAARELLGAPAAAVIQTSNFIGEMLQACAARGVLEVVLVGHIGKLTKVAAGLFNTHSRWGDARLETIAAMAAAEGASGPLVAQLLDLPTAEAAIPLLVEGNLTRVWDTIADRAAARASTHAGLPVACALIGYDTTIIGRSRRLRPRTGATGGITVVGVGPGPSGWLTPAAWRAIRHADVIVGGKRHLAQFAPRPAIQVPIDANLPRVMADIRALRDRNVVILASGDPGCFGILATLRRELPDLAWEVIPGISAMQVALAHLGRGWDEVVFTSAHGRGVVNVVEAAFLRPRVLAFTDHTHTAQVIAQALLDEGLDYPMVVLEHLGYPEERITRGLASVIVECSFDALSVIYIEREPPTNPMEEAEV